MRPGRGISGPGGELASLLCANGRDGGEFVVWMVLRELRVSGAPMTSPRGSERVKVCFLCAACTGGWFGKFKFSFQKFV